MANNKIEPNNTAETYLKDYHVPNSEVGSTCKTDKDNLKEKTKEALSDLKRKQRASEKTKVTGKHFSYSPEDTSSMENYITLKLKSKTKTVKGRTTRAIPKTEKILYSTSNLYDLLICGSIKLAIVLSIIVLVIFLYKDNVSIFGDFSPFFVFEYLYSIVSSNLEISLAIFLSSLFIYVTLKTRKLVITEQRLLFFRTLFCYKEMFIGEITMFSTQENIFKNYAINRQERLINHSLLLIDKYSKGHVFRLPHLCSREKLELALNMSINDLHNKAEMEIAKEVKTNVELSNDNASND